MIYVTILRPGGDLTSGSAKGFAGDAQVRSDHVLWNALQDIGKFLEELEVFLLGSFSKGAHEPALGINEIILDKHPEIPLKSRHLFQQKIPGRLCYQ